MQVLELYKTKMGMHVTAAVADNIDCRNHNLELLMDVNGKKDDAGCFVFVVEVVVADVL